MLKLSQNEVDQLLDEQRKKWRIFRLQQVRVQAKNEAARISSLVKNAENSAKQEVKAALKKDWDQQKEEKLNALQTELEEAVAGYGEAHKNAQDQMDQMKLKDLKFLQSQQKAKERGNQAMKSMLKQQKEQENKQKSTQEKRKATLTVEKIRAKNIASQKTPPRIRNQRVKKKPIVPSKVMLHQAGTFLTSSYVPKTILVQKEDNTNHAMNARDAARRELQKQKEIDAAKAKKKQEEFEKVLDRGRQALRKEREKQVRFNLVDNPPTTQSSSPSEPDSQVLSLKMDLVEHSSLIRPTSPAPVSEGIPEKDSKEMSPRSSEVESDLESSLPSHKDKQISIDCSDIHLKETVPADQLNFIHHEERVPVSEAGNNGEVKDIHLKDTVPIDQMTNIRNYINDPPRKAVPADTMKIVTEKCTQVCFEDEEVSTTGTESNSMEELFKSFATEYKELPKPQNLSFLKTLQNNLEKYNSVASTSSSATEYRSLPSITEDELKCKLKKIQENTKKVQNLLDSLKPKSILSTPTNVYIEPMKTEGSGKKMLSKRQKFEETKKLLIKQYTDGLMLKKQEELENISASTVGASGLTLPSPMLLNTPSTMSHDSPREFPKSSLVHSTPIELDHVPVRLSSTENSNTSSVPPSFSSTSVRSTSISSEKNKLQEILEKIEKLALIKKQLLSEMDETQETSSYSNGTSSTLQGFSDALSSFNVSPSMLSSMSISKDHNLRPSPSTSSIVTPHSSVYSTTLSSSSSAPPSSSSEPELKQLLQRFGLEWAQTMIKQMDRADQRVSSDSSIR